MPGATADVAVDAAPVPEMFIALTLKMYEVAFTRPVTVVDRIVLVGSANVAHAKPEFDEYSIK
jgi:hypothetical protein